MFSRRSMQLCKEQEEAGGGGWGVGGGHVRVGSAATAARG